MGAECGLGVQGGDCQRKAGHVLPHCGAYHGVLHRREPPAADLDHVSNARHRGLKRRHPRPSRSVQAMHGWWTRRLQAIKTCLTVHHWSIGRAVRLPCIFSWFGVTRRDSGSSLQSCRTVLAYVREPWCMVLMTYTSTDVILK